MRDKEVVRIQISSDTWWMYLLIQRYEQSIGIVQDTLIRTGCRAEMKFVMCVFMAEI